MGEAEDQVIARVKAMSEKVTGKEESNQNKARTLDLSAWNNSVFATDNVFDATEKNLIESFADKQGDDLFYSAAPLCAEKIPTECKSYSQMLQLVYAQRIKSDCVAYENSLKQQRSASAQKLLVAEKA